MWKKLMKDKPFIAIEIRMYTDHVPFLKCHFYSSDTATSFTIWNAQNSNAF